MKTLEDLFLDALADMYYAEQQLAGALPRMEHCDSSAKFELMKIAA